MWKYVCARCSHAYVLPGADLSFLYGVFLARSVSGEVAIYDPVADPFFQEVSDILRTDSRAAALSNSEYVALVQDVISVTFDPDSNGQSFVVIGSPGCPRCGSRAVSDFTETDEAIGHVETTVSQANWHSLNAQERRTAVIEQIGRQLGPA